MATDIFKRIPVCKHGSIGDFDIDLITALMRLEAHLRVKLNYNSGYRCNECNEKAGGAKNSAHLRGRAVDVAISGSRERYLVLKAALELGFRRVGVGKGILHLDIDTSLDQDVIWLY